MTENGKGNVDWSRFGLDPVGQSSPPRSNNHDPSSLTASGSTASGNPNVKDLFDEEQVKKMPNANFNPKWFWKWLVYFYSRIESISRLFSIAFSFERLSLCRFHPGLVCMYRKATKSLNFKENSIKELGKSSSWKSFHSVCVWFCSRLNVFSINLGHELVCGCRSTAARDGLFDSHVKWPTYFDLYLKKNSLVSYYRNDYFIKKNYRNF